MYISKIEIDHFGKWEHATFTFHPNLQVVQGLNESGKTTLRRFIEQMLFDFKQKKNGVYRIHVADGCGLKMKGLEL